MEGFLLTGMDAMTIEGSSNTPEPMNNLTFNAAFTIGILHIAFDFFINNTSAFKINTTQTLKYELQFEPTWVGGIVHTEYEKIEDKEEEVKDLEKKRTIKLPPSFMEGFLLTGMDAMTRLPSASCT
jgi:hypothetical protein